MYTYTVPSWPRSPHRHRHISLNLPLLLLPANQPEGCHGPALKKACVSQCCFSLFFYFFLENGDLFYLWELNIAPWCVVEATSLTVKSQLYRLHLMKQKSSSSTTFRAFSFDITNITISSPCLTWCMLTGPYWHTISRIAAVVSDICIFMGKPESGWAFVDLDDQGKFQQLWAKKYPKKNSKSFWIEAVNSKL